ncbi:MAG: hypothetical protein K2L76_01315 [Muribaculaceae bacterium]|nr:hypothetical protein [Muribaculaceae bacterium]
MKRLFIAMALLLACAGLRAQDTSDVLSRCTFSWGAQAGGSIDLSGHNMSTIDFSAVVGMRHTWIKMLGVGVGAHVMVSNACRTYPVFLSFRTDFSSSARRLLFMDTRAGIANNTFPGNVQRTGAYTYMGLGVNLATGRRFASFLTLGYTFTQRGDVVYGDGLHTFLPHLHFASAAIGISF